MQEAQAREIHNATDLSGYTHEDLRSADHWVKMFALDKLRQHLNKAGATVAMKEYVLTMVRCHYGSVETDKFLQAHQCYPDWVQ